MSFSPFARHRAPQSQKAVELVAACFELADFEQSLSAVLDDPRACKQLLHDYQQRLNEAFEQGGDVEALIRRRSELVDCLVVRLWESLHAAAGSEAAAMLGAVVAVGGFGRGELHPYSDVDLLILLKREPDKPLQELISTFVTFLWDTGLELGHSVRTLKDCVAMASDDVTVMTNILESRLLCGDDELFQQLLQKTAPAKMWSADDFFAAKWTEQRERYQSMAGPDYNLEPNIKTSPGGLRDIQTVIWIARRYWGEGDIQALIDKGFLNEVEASSFSDGLDFLWRVRYALHVVANKHEDRLLFEFQLKIAEALGYTDDDSNLAVEQFMESYYRCVTRLSVINEVLIQHFDESVINSGRPTEIQTLNERFVVRNGYIDVVNEQVLEDSLPALLEVFVLMAENPYILGIGASTIRIMRTHRRRVDDDFRQDPAVNGLFMRLLRSGHNVPKQLKRMRQYGILSAYLPAFSAIVGRMQFDLFHIYTVDVHTLEVVKNVYDFAYNGSQQDYILAAKIINGNMRIELLYLAALFHDIGKGRGGDHSTLGAVDAKVFAKQHGLNTPQTDLIVWLVENHLVMSSCSQKQDISDPDVIRDFCQQVGSRTRLDYLFVLTVADIQGTNPELWTSWRASLLRQLYAAATRLFRRGLENPVNKADVIAARQAEALELLAPSGLAVERIERFWAYQNDDYFLRENTRNIALMTGAILNRENRDEPLVVMLESHDFGADAPMTQVSIYHRLVENRFSFITLAIEELGLTIHDARLLLASDGMTLDTYYVLDLNEKPIPIGGEAAERIQSKLLQVITSADDRWFETEKSVSRRLKSFAWPAQTEFSNEETHGFSVLEVIAPDRPGLLTIVGQVFFAHKLRLHSAKIATLGERVEDVFFLTDRQDQKITDPEKIAAIQHDLRFALDENTQQ